MEDPQFTAILLGIATSAIAALANRKVRKTTEGLSAWIAWKLAGVLRIFGLLFSSVFLYLYLKKTQQIESEAVAAYLTLLATIFAGLAYDLIVTLSKTIKPNERIN